MNKRKYFNWTKPIGQEMKYSKTTPKQHQKDPHPAKKRKVLESIINRHVTQLDSKPKSNVPIRKEIVKHKLTIKNIIVTDLEKKRIKSKINFNLYDFSDEDQKTRIINKHIKLFKLEKIKEICLNRLKEYTVNQLRDYCMWTGFIYGKIRTTDEMRNIIYKNEGPDSSILKYTKSNYIMHSFPLIKTLNQTQKNMVHKLKLEISDTM